MAEGYDPRKTNVSADRFQNWMREKVVLDLDSVPGIGPANKHHFLAGTSNVHRADYVFA